MPKILSALGYREAADASFIKKGRSWLAEFTCPACGKSVSSKVVKVADEAKRLFPGVKCGCGQVVMFRDRHGNAIRWGANYSDAPMRKAA